MTALDAAGLPVLGKDVAVPAYDGRQVSVGIVHVGVVAPWNAVPSFT